MSDKKYLRGISAGFPLAGGIFMVYLAAFDNTIFNAIFDNITQTRFTVSIATVISASIPMFFAIGFIKQSIIPDWKTIHYYEQLLEKNIFWMMTIVFLLSVMIVNIAVNSIHLFNIPILIGCLSFSIYLILHEYNIRRKRNVDY